MGRREIVETSEKTAMSVRVINAYFFVAWVVLELRDTVAEELDSQRERSPGHEKNGARNSSCAVSTLRPFISGYFNGSTQTCTHASVRSLNTQPPGTKAYATVKMLARFRRM